MVKYRFNILIYSAAQPQNMRIYEEMYDTNRLAESHICKFVNLLVAR